MNVLHPPLAQALGPEAMSVVPGGYSYTLLAWLAIYVTMLFTWAVTATNVTMDARRTFGRSIAVRWASAAIGLLLFVALPAFAARLLLPSAILLAFVPVGYSILRFYRRGGTGLLRATILGTRHTAFLAYRTAINVGTIGAELSWAALQALLHFDWAKLKQLPEMARRRRVDVADQAHDVVLLQATGLPIDGGNDPRLKHFPATVLPSVCGIVRDAIVARASEILLTTSEQGNAELQYRIDGAVVDGPAIRGDDGLLVARAIKALAGASGARPGSGQEGMIPMSCGDSRSSLRVSVLPSSGRETLVMKTTVEEHRLVGEGLAGLGLDDAALATIRRFLGSHEGLVLFTGRPDSGKSTTIYAAITELERAGKRIATVEMSPRLRLVETAQLRAGGPGDPSFVQAIDTALRQDPDVLVVRDVVDRETAEACFRAAVAGRLVLAGFYADDSVTALDKMLALGVDRGLVRLSLRGIVCQRLARVLCESCKEAYQPTPDLLAKLGLRTPQAVQLHRQTGCPRCRGTGFRGRTGIFEVLANDEAVGQILAGGGSVADNRNTLRKALVRSLRQSAVAKACRGVTSVQEVARVLT